MEERARTRVVAAVIRRGDRYLCLQRGRSRYPYISERWEFPGGKVEPGEDDREALVREIREEMDWPIQPICLLGTVDYNYPDFCLRLVAYLCDAPATDDFKLLEHTDCRWLSASELPALCWTAADAELVKRFVTEVE